MRLSSTFFVISSIIGLVSATTACNSSSSCPEDLPCCSQYGECGVGAYCLGGCHPAFSYSYVKFRDQCQKKRLVGCVPSLLTTTFPLTVIYKM